MSNSFRDDIQNNVEDALDDVARSLRKAAKSAENIPGDTSEALSAAAEDVTAAAVSLRKQAITTARNMAQKAASGVREHPVASLAAALAAVAALVVVIGVIRNRD